MSKNILILGGYGGVGRPLARRLLQLDDIRLMIAGRNLQKAQAFANELADEFQTEKVSAHQADAEEISTLQSLLQKANLLLVCATVPDQVSTLAKAALENDCDWLDILVRQDVITQLQGFLPQIEQQSRLFITQGGFHPGMSAPLVRYAAPFFDQYDKAFVGMAMNTRFETAVSTHEVLYETGGYQAQLWENGNWRKATYRDMVKLDFGPPLGKRTCVPMDLTEMLPLPQELGLKHLGSYVAGFNWFVDNFVFPPAMLLREGKPRFLLNILGRLMKWGVNTLFQPPEKLVIQLDAEGKKDGQPLSLTLSAAYHDAYDFTAMAVMGCLNQYLSRHSEPGLWLMGNWVEPEPLMEDLQGMGVEMSINER